MDDDFNPGNSPKGKPGDWGAQMEKRAAALVERELGSKRYPVLTRFECPLCGGPHPKTSHPENTEGRPGKRPSDEASISGDGGGAEA